jgi:hypothetical protein
VVGQHSRTPLPLSSTHPSLHPSSLFFHQIKQQIDELARFVPRLIHVGRGGVEGGGPAAAGAVRAASLADALGLACGGGGGGGGGSTVG